MDTAWANTTTPAGLPPQKLLKLIFQVRVFYHIILLRYCALSGTDHCDSVFITHRHLRVLASQHHEFASGTGEAPHLHWASLHSLMLLQMTHEHMLKRLVQLSPSVYHTFGTFGVADSVGNKSVTCIRVRCICACIYYIII